MATAESRTRAASLQIENSGRSVDALEWKSVSSVTTVVIGVEGDVAELVGPVAERLMERNRVIGINLNSAWDPLTIAWWLREPIVLLAQGASGRLACETARLAPGALRALVLADYAPEPEASDHSEVDVPVLVFHGRESSTSTLR